MSATHLIFFFFNSPPEQTLTADARRLITPEEFRSGVVPYTDPRLIQYLAENPREVYALSPYKFQEVVGELLRRHGYPDIRVGPKGADGGVDLFAERLTELGRELVLVACKRNREDRKVGEPIVKQLAYEVNEREATRGLIVTTSTFTEDALKLIEEKRYKLSGKDFDHFQRWVRQARERFGQ